MKKAVVCPLILFLLIGVVFSFHPKTTRTVLAADKTPRLKKVFPHHISAGAPTFTVRVDGKHFADGAQILFDGVPLDSSRVVQNGQRVLAEVDSSAVVDPGDHIISVLNPDGTTTDSDTMTVHPADPDSIIRLQTNATEESSSLAAIPELRGTALKDNSQVVVWGKAVPTAVQGTFAQFLIAENFLLDSARIPVVVRDKKGNYSNTDIFFVVVSPAKINSLDPDSIDVGDEDFELRVFGNYDEDAQIVINDVIMPTTNDKKGRIITTVPASLRAQPGQLVVRVEQKGIQSTDSILTVTPTDSPFIYTIAPLRLRVGEGRSTLDIVGANFDGQSKAFIDGAEAKIRAQTKRRLTVLLPADFLSIAGQHTIQVQDKDGNPTNTRVFDVVPDVSVATAIGSDREGFNTDPCVSRDEALLRRPRRMNFGPDGLIYFTDQQNNAIRTLNPSTGEVCTVAGVLGEDGYNDSGNELDKPPTFSFPNGVAVAADGTIYVSENGNSVIRRILRNGSDITVDTFAGTFRPVKESSQERLNSTKAGIEAYRDSSLLDSSFKLPDEMLVASDGTIYMADPGNHAIRRIVTRGGQQVVETVAGNGVPGFADGAAENARFNLPTSIALSPDERFLFVADTNNNRVRRIDLVTNFVSTSAGSGDHGADDGPPGEATFSRPIGLAIDADGVVYVAELDTNDIRQVDVSGNVSTLAGGTNSKFRDGLGVDAKFAAPRGLTIDRQRGILYVADYENMRIRTINLR
jgi:sugar lactone lactonase YvrE